MDGEGRPLRSKRQVNFCHLWRLGLKSHVSMSRTPLLAGLGICGTRFCLSQAQMSKPQGTWVGESLDFGVSRARQGLRALPSASRTRSGQAKYPASTASTAVAFLLLPGQPILLWNYMLLP